MKLDLARDWNEDVREMLIRQGWRVRLEEPNYQVELVKRGERPIRIPLSEEFADFYDQGVQVLDSLSSDLGQTSNELLYQAQLTKFDVLSLRHPSEDPMGIPLSKAEEAFTAFIDSFQVAARSVSSQMPEHKGSLKSDQLNSLLKSEARLGHTQRGSFVFRILVPIQKPLLEVEADSSPGHLLPRRATVGFTTLVRNTKSAAEDPNNGAIDFLSAPFVEKVRLIASSARVGTSVQITSAFSRYDPIIEKGSTELTAEFAREEEVKLSNIVDQLKHRKNLVPDTLVGYVYKLMRHPKAGSDNMAWIRAQMPDGKVRTFSLKLTDLHYNMAVRAHHDLNYVKISSHGGFSSSKIEYPESFSVLQDFLQ